MLKIEIYWQLHKFHFYVVKPIFYFKFYKIYQKLKLRAYTAQVCDKISFTKSCFVLGKEILLRRYLNGQTPESDPYTDRGFLSMAMQHLQQSQPQQNNNNNRFYPDQQQQMWQGRRNIGVDG